MLIGMFLRNKVKVLQKLFLPASVIGGIVGLILGPELLGGINESVVLFSEETVNIWSLLPSVLIIPIFASVPLGNFRRKNAETKAEDRRTGNNKIALAFFCIMMGVMLMQIMIGLFINAGFMAVNPDTGLYSVFGFELAMGFTGGHATAGAIGNIYQSLGFDFWELGQGVATTFATFGLIGGMLLGIVFINIAARRGKTAIMKKPVELSNVMLTGLVKNKDEQESMGRESTKNFSIETLTVHLAIILGGCGLAYVLLALLKKIPGTTGALMGQVPVWSLAMLVMFGINAALKAFKLDWLIDKKVVSRISGTLTDFAIVSAVASMPLSRIADYIVPILVITAVGIVATYFYIFCISKFCCGNNCPFEHSIIAWGAATGVLMTGIVLLKICDPDYSTPALSNFSKGFAIMSVFQVVTILVAQTMMVSCTTIKMAVITAIAAVVFTVAALVVGYIRKRRVKIAA